MKKKNQIQTHSNSDSLPAYQARSSGSVPCGLALGALDKILDVSPDEPEVDFFLSPRSVDDLLQLVGVEPQFLLTEGVRDDLHSAYVLQVLLVLAEDHDVVLGERPLDVPAGDGGELSQLEEYRPGPGHGLGSSLAYATSHGFVDHWLVEEAAFQRVDVREFLVETRQRVEVEIPERFQVVRFK